MLGSVLLYGVIPVYGFHLSFSELHEVPVSLLLQPNGSLLGYITSYLISGSILVSKMGPRSSQEKFDPERAIPLYQIITQFGVPCKLGKGVLILTRSFEDSSLSTPLSITKEHCS